MISDFGEDLMPRRATKKSAGYDVYSPVDMFAVPISEGGEVYRIDTGLRLQDGDLKDDQVLFLMPRSSLGTKYMFRLAHTTGVIDADYRDTIKLAFVIENGTLEIKRGDRIAQFVILNYGTLPNEIPPVKDRNGGFGSTGA